MPFTTLFAVFALLALIVVFGLTLKIKGWKAALLTTGVAAVAVVLLFIGIIYAITSSM
jgi:hypothetical protein